jgi:hypothetical protein
MPNPNHQATGKDCPIMETAVVSPSDSTDIPDLPRAIWIGVGGDITLMAAGDTTSRLFKNVSSGTLLPIRARRIYSTGTTAQSLIACY